MSSKALRSQLLAAVAMLLVAALALGHEVHNAVWCDPGHGEVQVEGAMMIEYSRIAIGSRVITLQQNRTVQAVKQIGGTSRDCRQADAQQGKI